MNREKIAERENKKSFELTWFALNFAICIFILHSFIALLTLLYHTHVEKESKPVFLFFHFPIGFEIKYF